MTLRVVPDPVPTPIQWGERPRIMTAPYHHFCSVIERGDIAENLHSATIATPDPGIKLDGKRNKVRLVEVTACGPGRWVPGGRQPAEVATGDLCYVKERTIPFRLHLRKQNHFYIPMDGILATLDRDNVRLRPAGQFVMTREVDERARVAVMGDLPFHIGKTMGLDKKGEEADDVGCNKTRIEEVVAVGPGKFGGYRQRVREGADDRCEPPWVLESDPYWETPDCKPGDLVVFTDIARPVEITLAGRKFTLFEFDHAVAGILDRAI